MFARGRISQFSTRATYCNYERFIWSADMSTIRLPHPGALFSTTLAALAADRLPLKRPQPRRFYRPLWRFGR